LAPEPTKMCALGLIGTSVSIAPRATSTTSFGALGL
jgi:hypothetical protein